MPLTGGGGKKTLKFTKSEVCLLHLPPNPPVNSLMRWPGLWLRICDHSQVFCACFLGTCLPLWFAAWPLPKVQLALCAQWPSSPPLQLNLRIIQFQYWRWLNSLEMWFHSSFLETIRLAIVISHLGEIFSERNWQAKHFHFRVLMISLYLMGFLWGSNEIIHNKHLKTVKCKTNRRYIYYYLVVLNMGRWRKASQNFAVFWSMR